MFLDQSYLPWRHIAADRGLPRCVTLAMVIDPSEVGLQEIRSEVGTVTVPPEYLDGIEAGAVFLRDAEEQVTPLPLTELDVMEIDDLPGMTAKANEAVTEWYEHVAQLSRRDKIMNGAKVYYIGMVAPLLKATGTYEYFCDELDLWELHPIVSEAYYDCMGEMAQEFVPTQIIFGYGWSEIPDTPDTESPYGELLADIQDTGWNSDLTGMQPVPEYWEDRMNDDGLLDVPLTKTDGEVAREDLGDFLSSL